MTHEGRAPAEQSGYRGACRSSALRVSRLPSDFVKIGQTQGHLLSRVTQFRSHGSLASLKFTCPDLNY